MKIWIIRDDGEYGPYGKGDIFGFLNTGDVTNEDLARVEGESEVATVQEVLQRPAELFSFEKITAAQEAAPVTTVPDVSIPSNSGDSAVSEPLASEDVRPRSAGVARVALVSVCLIGALATIGLILGLSMKGNAGDGSTASSHAIKSPVEPTQAEHPTEPLQAERPAELAQAERPAESAQAERPMEPAQAERPTEPAQAERPVELAQAERPVDLAQAERPLEPVKAESPVEPAQADATTSQIASKPPEPMELSVAETKAPEPPAAVPSKPAAAPVALVSLPPKTSPLVPVVDSVSVKTPAAKAVSKPPEILSELELDWILRERSGASAVKVFDDEEEWSKERATTFKDSFELDTTLKWNPKVKVQYRVPMTVQKRPTPEASNIVVFCTWPGGAAPPSKTVAPPKPGQQAKQTLQDYMRGFSEGLGFSAFSLEIVTNEKDMANTREAYFYAGPEWVDVVRRARDEIIRRHHLKERKLLLYGPSIGGTFAQRLALALGDEVGAVAIQNAPSLTLPTKSAKTAWFVGVTRGDGGGPENVRLAQTLRGLGIPCIYAVTQPQYRGGGNNLYHSISGEARRTAYQFLAAVAERADAKGENDPARWPYVRDTVRPLMILRNDRQAEQRIPVARREYMPSREFVHMMQSMPASMQTVALDGGASVAGACMVGLPPLGKPKGVILIGHKYGFNDLPQLLNNINYLAEKGFVVLSPQLRSNPLTDIQSTVALISRSQLLSRLPLSFIGMGAQNETLWKFLLSQQAIKPVALVPIDFEPNDLLDESRWPVGRRIDWPLLFLYDQRDYSKAATAEEAAQAAAKLQKVKTFTDSLQQRNQVAAVRFVPVGQKSDHMVAQKSIENACEFIEVSVTGKIRTQFK